MFDGNHRTRRTINLSGRRAARTLRGKQDILDASKRQRQDRLAEQRRVAAAVSIQRIIRGRRDRQLLLQRIAQQLQQLPTSPNTVVVNHLLGHWTTLWNVRLRLEEKPVDTKQLSLWPRGSMRIFCRKHNSSNNNNNLLRPHRRSCTTLCEQPCRVLYPVHQWTISKRST